MDIMLDIETLGTRPGSVIASIGAVRFDPVRGDIDTDGAFHLAIDIVDAVKQGFEMDPRTVKWWLGQSDAAKAATFADKEAAPLLTALTEFVLWYVGPPQPMPEDWAEPKDWEEVTRRTSLPKVWCHGATFDAPILAEA